ncbi:MAG: hypothetical protein HOW73_08520 [Polyangiaceae bacterium]|nr:hypothetical protein [Polyangiaceae bacterium]
MTPESKQRIRAQLWAAFITFHVLAVIVMSLPGEGITSKAQWQSENLRSDFAGWANALRKVGIAISDEELAEKARAVAEGYVDARSVLSAPFEPYQQATGARQGWAMFASPQRHPAEVHVDVFERGEWRPLFRPRSAEYSWFTRRLDHHRLRKLSGRFARGFNRGVYDDLARYLADRALHDFPTAERVRVRLYSWDALPPERVRAGEKPVGEYKEPREYTRDEAGNAQLAQRGSKRR